MAFFRERFSKLTKLWTVSSVSISQYNSKRLAKDIEKESTVSYTDIMAVLTSLPTVMQRYLAEGHTVKLEGIGTFYISVQCSKTGVEKKELCSAEQITNVKVQFRPEMETPSTGRKGKRKNTLVADDLSWTYLPATEKKNTEEGVDTPTPTPDPTPGPDEG
jgi:predicted histone-like DNA-binding protein